MSSLVESFEKGPWRLRPTRLRSRDHAAFKHFVGDRRRDPVDEHLAHLRIATQKIYGFLFPLRFRLPSLLPQLLARGILVLLDDLVGDLVQYRVLGAAYAGKQQDRKRQQGYSLQFRFHTLYGFFSALFFVLPGIIVCEASALFD